MRRVWTVPPKRADLCARKRFGRTSRLGVLRHAAHRAFTRARAHFSRWRARCAKFFSRRGRPYRLRVSGQWLSDGCGVESITNPHRQDIVRISALPIAIEL
jgi:hypothetical protein